MRIAAESLIHHPRDVVFSAYRDRLSEVAAYMDNVRAIEVVSREDGADGTVRLHNVWRANAEIPNFAQSIVKPDMLAWDDHATWDPVALRCDWNLHTRAFTEAVRCSGTNTFFEVDEHTTRVVLAGELLIDATQVRVIPRFLAGSVGPQVEKFAVALITPNLEQVNAALQRFLDAHG